MTVISIRLVLAVVFLAIAVFYYGRRDDPVSAIFWLVLGDWAARLVGLVAVY